MEVLNAKGKANYIFFAFSEGFPSESVPPSISWFELTNEDIVKEKTLSFSQYDVDASDMGSDHAKFNPEGMNIYFGSNERFTNVVSRKSISNVKQLK